MQFGFLAQQWEIPAEALKFHAVYNEIAKTETSYFGMRYIIEGHIPSPDKRNPCVRSVWFIEKEANIPYFVTAYPLKGKSK